MILSFVLRGEKAPIRALFGGIQPLQRCEGARHDAKTNWC